MMEVQKFIAEKGWEALTTDLGIIVRDYPDEGLAMLNYNQIDSPKTHPVVIECRSLILDKKTTNVISRSFDRFFNYGEVLEETEQVDFSRSVILEKCDGSLIKIYWCPNTNRWEISTRSQAFGEMQHSTSVKTFRDEVIEAGGFVDENTFQSICYHYFNVANTYIFELIGPTNRIVTPYTHAELVLLSVRRNNYPYQEYSNDLMDSISVYVDHIYITSDYLKNTIYQQQKPHLIPQASLKGFRKGLLCMTL